MREFRYPRAVRMYWRLTVLAAVAAFLWLAAYFAQMIDLVMFGGRWDAAAEFAERLFSELARHVSSVIPYVTLSGTALLAAFCVSTLVVYALIVFPLCLVWRRRINSCYHVASQSLVRCGRRQSSVDFADVRDVRACLFIGATFRTPYEAIVVPLGLEGSPELLAGLKAGIDAAGGNFSEAAFQKALDLAAFARWKIENGVRLIGCAALLAVALAGTGYWLGTLFWRRGLPILAAGASISLMPMYLAGPWWLARRRFRGVSREVWHPPEPAFAGWTAFLFAAAAWGTYEALLLVVLFVLMPS